MRRTSDVHHVRKFYRNMHVRCCLLLTSIHQRLPLVYQQFSLWHGSHAWRMFGDMRNQLPLNRDVMRNNGIVRFGGLRFPVVKCQGDSFCWTERFQYSRFHLLVQHRHGDVGDVLTCGYGVKQLHSIHHNLKVCALHNTIWSQIIADEKRYWLSNFSFSSWSRQKL